MKVIKAVIWDMDGVIIDTEKFWPKAERKVFSEVGVPEDEDFENATTGLRTLDVIDFWYKKYPWDKNTYPFDQIKQEIIKKMTFFVESDGEFLPFVLETFKFFKSNGFIQSIASSSPSSMINRVVKKLELSEYIDSISSGEDQKKGKPSPDVYISAAKKLSIDPDECIAIEDSYNGAISAHRAGMHVFIVPDKLVFENSETLKKFKGIKSSTLVRDIRDLIDFKFK